MKKLLFVCASFMVSTSVFAAGHPNTGCGLGTELIENQNSVLKQVFAGTTNGTSGNQTFGITSGTSGCAKPTSLVSADQLNEFVASNMDALAIDIANGHGEVIDAVAAMMKVEDKPLFVAKLQSNFAVIYGADSVTSADVIDRIVAVIS